jgi:putative transposase
VAGESHLGKAGGVIVRHGIDAQGYKHVLGLSEGATENATVVTSLLSHLVEHGIAPGVKRLFIIDGSKALRAAIEAVFGTDNAVQRCRLHKERNVTDHLPDEQKEYAKLSMRAAFTLTKEHRLVHDANAIVWGNEWEQSRTFETVGPVTQRFVVTCVNGK